MKTDSSVPICPSPACSENKGVSRGWNKEREQLLGRRMPFRWQDKLCTQKILEGVLTASSSKVSSFQCSAPTTQNVAVHCNLSDQFVERKVAVSQSRAEPNTRTFQFSDVRGSSTNFPFSQNATRLLDSPHQLVGSDSPPPRIHHNNWWGQIYHTNRFIRGQTSYTHLTTDERFVCNKRIT